MPKKITKSCGTCANQGNVHMCVGCQYGSYYRTKKSRKYRNTPTFYNGRQYDSKKEAKWAAILDMAKKATDRRQRIACWFPQVGFVFTCGSRLIVDFVVCYASGNWEIHEVKGGNVTKTQAYRLKKKMLKNEYGLEIKEV